MHNPSCYKNCLRQTSVKNPDILTPQVYMVKSVCCQWKLKEFTFKDFKEVLQGLSVLALQFIVFCSIMFHMISCVMYSQCLLPIVEAHSQTGWHIRITM